MGGGASKKKKAAEAAAAATNKKVTPVTAAVKVVPPKQPEPTPATKPAAAAAAATPAAKPVDPNAPLLPSETEDKYAKDKSPAENQVGGHGGKHSLLFKDGQVWKPLGEAGSARELPFYERIANGGNQWPLLTKYDPPLLPRYFGKKTVESTEWGTLEYMALEDLTAGFKHPSILDLKMGIQTWDSDCTEEKKAAHIKRDAETTTARMGFRFCGMKRWDKKAQKYHKYPKHFGWDATNKEAMDQHLMTFVHDGEQVRADVLAVFMDRVDKIKKFLEAGQWRFYAASILLVYDDTEPCKAECRLIDFAHAWELNNPEEPQRDEGFIYGTTMLQYYLQRVLNKSMGRSVDDVTVRL